MFNKILDSEIEWCEQNKGSMPDEYRRGFIAGLQQASYLIRAAKQRMVWQDGEMVDDDDLLDRAAELPLERNAPIPEAAPECQYHAANKAAGFPYCPNCGERLLP